MTELKTRKIRILEMSWKKNQVTQTWDKSRINQAGLRLLYTVLQYAMSEDGAGIFTEF